MVGKLTTDGRPAHRCEPGSSGKQKPARHSYLPQWRWPWAAFFAALLVVLGVGSMLYPTAAGWVDQYNQSQIISGYTTEVGTAVPEAKVQLEMAKRYNEALNFGAEIQAGERLPTGFGDNSDAELKYNEILKTTPSGMMARLAIPKIDLDLPIYHGTSDATLMEGLGHLEGTSLPVGGESTHAVITGHRGLAQATMFTYLDKVKVGDTFRIEIFGEVLTYEVRSTQVVDPDESEKLRIVPGRDLVTLVTCTPLGINSHRILVAAERIPTPETAPTVGEKPQVPHFPWWLLIYAAVIVAAGIFVWRAGYYQAPAGVKKKTKNQRGSQERTSETALP